MVCVVEYALEEAAAITVVGIGIPSIMTSAKNDTKGIVIGMSGNF